MINNKYSHINKIILIFLVIFAATLHAQEIRYPSLSSSQVIMVGDSGKWDADKVHTLSVLKVNKLGFKYWGYYGLSYYAIFGGLDTNLLKAGLAMSNDLVHWKKYEGNPIINSNCRWPSVIKVGSTFYMFSAAYDHVTNDSRIVMRKSKDGIHFGEEQIVVPADRGMQNQNPFIYFDRRDRHFYLFYYHGIEKSRDTSWNNWNIFVRKSKKIEDLKYSNPVILLSARYTMAAPSIVFYKNKYFLTVEAWNPEKWGKKWVTVAYVSDKIDGRYEPVSNNPILDDNDACAFQYLLDNHLHIFYSHCLDTAKSNWDLRMVKTSK